MKDNPSRGLYYNLTGTPLGCGVAPFSTEQPDKLVQQFSVGGHFGKWSGKGLPPDIGNKVRVTFNGLGTGTVLSYFVESGWLGVQVKLDNDPEWRIANGRAGLPACVFGIELGEI